MNAFWFNFFNSGWVGFGLCTVVPIILLVVVLLCFIGAHMSDDWQAYATKEHNLYSLVQLALDRDDNELYDERRATLDDLRKHRPQLFSFQEKLGMWLVVFIAAFLFIIGLVGTSYRDNIKLGVTNMSAKYVSKSTQPVKSFVLLKDREDAGGDNIKQTTKNVADADQIVIKLDNGKTEKIAGPQAYSSNHNQSVVCHQKMTDKKSDDNKITMKLVAAKPKAKYRNYHGLKTQQKLIVMQEFAGRKN